MRGFVLDVAKLEEEVAHALAESQVNDEDNDHIEHQVEEVGSVVGHQQDYQQSVLGQLEDGDVRQCQSHHEKGNHEGHRALIILYNAHHTVESPYNST